jgi:hypothetical protein
MAVARALLRMARGTLAFVEKGNDGDGCIDLSVEQGVTPNAASNESPASDERWDIGSPDAFAGL